jgi:hypothetical protein
VRIHGVQRDVVVNRIFLPCNWLRLYPPSFAKNTMVMMNLKITHMMNQTSDMHFTGQINLQMIQNKNRTKRTIIYLQFISNQDQNLNIKDVPTRAQDLKCAPLSFCQVGGTENLTSVICHCCD